MGWKLWLGTSAFSRREEPCAGDPTRAARKAMVASQIRGGGMTDPRVLAVMERVPRHEFVPPESRHDAYADTPLPIGHGQTISQPYIVALMTEMLAVGPTSRVLEIGTGSGYQAAVLGGLVAEVYSMEIIAPLAREARRTLGRLGYKNIHVKAGDGYQGWPAAAPFDGIIVTCAPEHVPPALAAQLREGGRMVIPVGEAGSAQELTLLEKCGGAMREKSTIPVRFVPMTGEISSKQRAL